jgi:hypothetical protein
MPLVVSEMSVERKLKADFRLTYFSGSKSGTSRSILMAQPETDLAFGQQPNALLMYRRNKTFSLLQ